MFSKSIISGARKLTCVVASLSVPLRSARTGGDDEPNVDADADFELVGGHSVAVVAADVGDSGARVVARAGDTVELRCDLLGAAIEWSHANGFGARLGGASGDGDESGSDGAAAAVAAAATTKGANIINSAQLSDQDIGSLANATADKLVSLVFWYKDSNPAPIYTLDARHAPLDPTALFSSASSASSRDTSAAQSPHQSGRARTTQSGAASERVREIGLLNLRLLQRAKHYRSQSQQLTSSPVGGGGGAQVSVVSGSELEAAPRAVGLSSGAASEQTQQQQPALATMATSNQIQRAWPLVLLTLRNVGVARSAGAYKCRVDFRRARTLTRQVRVLVQGE